MTVRIRRRDTRTASLTMAASCGTKRLQVSRAIHTPNAVHIRKYSINATQAVHLGSSDGAAHVSSKRRLMKLVGAVPRIRAWRWRSAVVLALLAMSARAYALDP